MARRKGTHRTGESVIAHPVLASRRRVELLDVLRARSEPTTAGALAELMSLHVSTVRFHLDALLDAGLVTAEFEKAPRGRPRRLYRAVTPREDGRRAGYRMLAEVLAQQWATPGDDPVERALEAGRQWAPDAATRTLDGAIADASGLFEEMGFEPETETKGKEIRIRLHSCPFESVARKSPEVVCSLHLGLLRGILDRADVPDVDSELTPWDTPHTCVALVARR
ncbi:MAG: helix-turn-helix domain-containing protein [Rhodococcus sp.]|nr:helix-turn-helix domain-containing protein [Rhodococcus sp. (in: high G+C Gram-positive bacteria)]